MPDNQKFTEIKISSSRKALLDVLDKGANSHYTPVFTEIDITKARQLLKERKNTNAGRISFLSWIIKRIAISVENNKQIHALPHKKNKLVMFDNVDISVVIERKISEENATKSVTLPYIIRNANNKTEADIYIEIHEAQNELIDKDDVSLGQEKNTRESKIFLVLPKFLRNFILWNRLDRDAFIFKKKMGTVLVSSVGMFLKHHHYTWSISRSIHPLSILITGLIKKPAVIDDQIVIREFICLTFGFHHNVIDGAPVARFITSLKKMVENAEGL